MSTRKETGALVGPTARAISRRELLRLIREATFGLTLSAALGRPADAATSRLERMLPGLSVLPDARVPARLSAALPAPDLSALQMPFWGDGSNFDQPQYYQTIQAGRRPQINKTMQSADIDGDGQDELIARGPNGIVVHHFDPHTGQWLPMTNGPAWSDPGPYWNSESYQTIQTADIDGDGKDELLGWNGSNIEAWKYDPTTQTWNQLADGPAWSQYNEPPFNSTGWGAPQYYQTIQCADIDGDGKAELLAHAPDNGSLGSGIQVWKYNPGSNSWSQMPIIEWEYFLDLFMNIASCYQVLQCADIDGDGQDEVLGMSGGNIYPWKYNAASQTWNPLAAGPPWGFGNGNWNGASNYQTIQCADIDGDGRAELLGRAVDGDPNGSGVQVWKYDGGSNSWSQMPSYPNWTDYWGWNQPQYYQTIQAADIDGDGAAELISRAPDTYPGGGEIKIGKYTTNNQQWNEYPTAMAWTDAAAKSNDQKTAWDEVQYFSTIQTARVLGDSTAQDLTQNPPVYPNANNPLVTDANGKSKAVAAVFGRGIYSTQTWRFNAAAFSSNQWTQTSAGFPSYTDAATPPGQNQVYAYLNGMFFKGKPYEGTDLRASYYLISVTDLGQMQGDIPVDGPNQLASQGVSDFDWYTVRNEIFWELESVQNVATNVDTLNTELLATAWAGSATLPVIRKNLQNTRPKTESTGGLSGTFVTLIEIVTSAAWAVTALADPPVALAAGLLASSAIGLSFFETPDQSYRYGDGDTEFNILQNDLVSGFMNAQSGNTYSGNQYTRNFGLLQIQGATSYSPSNIPPPVNDATDNSYAIYAYKKLAPIYWEIGALIPSDMTMYANAGGGSEGQITARFQDVLQTNLYAQQNGINFYAGNLNFTLTALYESDDEGGEDNDDPVSCPVDSVAGGALQTLFGGPAQGGLGASLTHFVNNNAGAGWGETPNGQIYYGPVDDASNFTWIRLNVAGATVRPPRAASQGTRLVSAARLARNASGEILATVTIKNAGDRAVTNLRLTEAKLAGKAARAASRYTRLRPARTETVTVRFPASAGGAGKNVILSIQGRHKRGTFGGSFRVKLP